MAEEAEIVRLLELATSLDPNFLEAWVYLSEHHSNVYNSPFDKTETRINAARDALKKAEAIDPDHPLTLVARGSYYYYGFRDYDRALQEYLAATRKAPNNADAWAAVGYIYRRQGRWAEHIETMKKALELDPRNGNTAQQLAGSYRGLREHELAVHLLRHGPRTRTGESAGQAAESGNHRVVDG